jgi:hypothetical protein
MTVGTLPRISKRQAMPAPPAVDARNNVLRFGSRQPSAAPSVLGLVVLLIAGALVAVSTFRWANTAIALPSPESLTAGLAHTHPQRPLVGSTPVAGAVSPNCSSFSSVFSTLEDTIGDTMGQPLECPHTDPATGDTLQRTSTGLAIFRHRSQTATFTDGYRRWAVDARGLIRWEGEALDPPAGR